MTAVTLYAVFADPAEAQRIGTESAILASTRKAVSMFAFSHLSLTAYMPILRNGPNPIIGHQYERTGERAGPHAHYGTRVGEFVHAGATSHRK